MKQVGIWSAAILLLSCSAMLIFAQSGRSGRPAAEADFRPPAVSEQVPAVIYDSVTLQHDSSDWPYLHSVRTNKTDKTIVKIKYSMLAYDQDGQPLKIQWYMMDSSDQAAYECEVEVEEEILPNQTWDEPGGWSLYDGEKMKGWPKVGDGGPNKVAYALYCDLQIKFSDGTVWTNPNYEDWLEQYKGKPVQVEALKNYYPFVQPIPEK